MPGVKVGSVSSKFIIVQLQAACYTIAGVVHFAVPAFYLPLIPDYIPAHRLVNILAGITEIVLGILLMIPWSRRLAALGLVLMLIAFIPAHIHFIEIGSCTEILCVPTWIAWMRLAIVHPLLIAWAYMAKKSI